MSLRDYFDAEMRLLHEASQRFAEKYPEQAGRLNLNARDRDPYVERLLEGFAFLTANIRARLDDDIPEISAAFLQQYWPQLLFPFPSATILEFSWRAEQLTKSLLIPKNTLAQSVSVGEEKTACRFSTTAELVLNPIKLTQLTLSEPSTGGTLFQFEFEIKSEAKIPEEIVFYLHADPAVSLELFWAFTESVTKINSFTNGKKSYVGDQSLITSAYNSEEETLLPLCNRSFYGFNLLQDYFAFREKMLFIKIKNVKKYLDIHVQKIFPSEMKINKENFKLHCVPAVNLYSHSSEPIQFNAKRFSYPLIIDNYRKESMVLQEIISVTGADHQIGTKKIFQPDSYQLELSELGNYLKFSEKALASMDISCVLNVSNGHYPRQYLREGMINQLIDQPVYLQVKNITRPSSFILASHRNNYRWKLISLLSFQFASLSDKNNLKKLLHLFDLENKKENQKKINAIYQIDTKPFEKLYRGAFMQGVEIKCYVEESGFRNLADIYLFGSVLHQFFKMAVSLNLFVETKLYAHPSQREFLWKAEVGKQTFI